LQLEDLAERLGYSKTLISMVLNGKGNHYGISKKTQAIVLDAVTKLDYAPNKFAKALRTGKSYFVGLIVTDIANMFYAQIAKSIEATLFENGYGLMVFSSNDDDEKEKLLVEMMINQQGVDGLIVVSALKVPSFYQQKRFEKTPIIFIDRILPLHKTNYVVIDNYGGSMEIVNHLITHNFTQISCFCLTPMDLSAFEDRLNGYKAALLKNGLNVEEAFIKRINFSDCDCDIELSLTALMEANKKLDALFILDSRIATSVLKNLKKKEFSDYFSDVKIACFDDIELFTVINRPIISNIQPTQEMGKISAQLLLDIINESQRSKSTVVLSTKLIDR
jgi:LacI family transcriptional regulator